MENRTNWSLRTATPSVHSATLAVGFLTVLVCAEFAHAQTSPPAPAPAAAVFDFRDLFPDAAALILREQDKSMFATALPTAFPATRFPSAQSTVNTARDVGMSAMTDAQPWDAFFAWLSGLGYTTTANPVTPDAVWTCPAPAAPATPPRCQGFDAAAIAAVEPLVARVKAASAADAGWAEDFLGQAKSTGTAAPPLHRKVLLVAAVFGSLPERYRAFAGGPRDANARPFTAADLANDAARAPLIGQRVVIVRFGQEAVEGVVHETTAAANLVVQVGGSNQTFPATDIASNNVAVYVRWPATWLAARDATERNGRMLVPDPAALPRLAGREIEVVSANGNVNVGQLASASATRFTTRPGGTHLLKWHRRRFFVSTVAGSIGRGVTNTDVALIGSVMPLFPTEGLDGGSFVAETAAIQWEPRVTGRFIVAQLHLGWSHARGTDPGADDSGEKYSSFFLGFEAQPGWDLGWARLRVPLQLSVLPTRSFVGGVGAEWRIGSGHLVFVTDALISPLDIPGHAGHWFGEELDRGRKVAVGFRGGVGWRF